MTDPTTPAAETTTAYYYAVCNCYGPISVLLEADTVEEARAAFAELDGRAAIDGASTDLEDELGVDGTGMDEADFAAACEEHGAVPVCGLEGDGSIKDAWHLWVLHA